jgi:hypothetical protein
MIAIALAAAVQCGTLTTAVEHAVLSVDPRLVHAVIQNESAFQPRATSKVGAQGLMQLMPDTGRAVGVCQPYDVAQNVIGGTRYLKSLLDRYHGNTRLAVAAYNSGPGAVDKYRDVPPYAETQAYVSRVMGDYAAYQHRAPEVLRLMGSSSASRSIGPRAPGAVHVRPHTAPVSAFGFAAANPTNLAVRVR